RSRLAGRMGGDVYRPVGSRRVLRAPLRWREVEEGGGLARLKRRPHRSGDDSRRVFSAGCAADSLRRAVPIPEIAPGPQVRLSANGRRVHDRDTREAATVSYPMSNAHGIDHSCDATGTRAVSDHRTPYHCLTGWRLHDDEWIRQWQLSTRDLFVGSLTLAPA